ncbi:ABC transporter permease [Jiangella aurantiaca]|uniref:ABC transporter permease n=1 Tax=Jiangella aurantiaca TaxID=2530373 RepID=A0A4R5A1Q0_9ACTN|nr:ABC transporter permease [Jiangella aurantiaca]TDD64554.1 ABC transporter permease [Jiangella aurantiaca]
MSTDTAPEVQPAASSPVDGPSRVRRELVRFMPLLILGVLLVLLSLRNPDLLTQRSLLTMADSAAPLMVLAVGITVVILCGGIDLSIGALASFASVLTALWVPTMSSAVVVPVVLVCALAGVVQGWIHIAARVPSFIVTLGGMSLWTGLALAFSGASTIAVTDLGALRWAFTRVGGWPSAILVALGLVAVLGAVLRFTPFGRWVSSIGHAEPAARLAGLPVSGVKIAAFGISGACAGLAGVLLVARTFSGAPTLGDSLLLPAVAAVIVGGTAITGGHGGLFRTVVGALIVVLLRVGLSLIGVDAGFEPIFYGLLIIIAVTVTIDRSKVAVLK